MHIHSGWLSNAKVLNSPNFNQRPNGAAVSLLVVHGISLPPGEFGGGYIQQFFLNTLDPKQHPYFATVADVQVSAHCLIDRTGGITQFVSFDDRAWHAGRSCYCGERECNNYSIGIELEGTDDIPYSSAQYKTLSELTLIIQQAYPAVTHERIVGHSDIAPGRKTDPGAIFDWQYYRKLIKHT